MPYTLFASKINPPEVVNSNAELMRHHVYRVWSRWIVYFQAGAVSRHYYHYFASAFVQETAVEF